VVTTYFQIESILYTVAVIIQHESNEAPSARDDQLMAAVVDRPGGPEGQMAFETSTVFNQFVVHDLSKLLGRVLQELPEVQKEVIHLASKGISRREITAKKIKLSLGTATARHLLA
jgi:hypothetical protein